MTDTIFRLQALEHQGEQVCGELIASQPLSMRWLTLFLVSITLVALICLAMGNYSRKASVSGHLVPEQGLIDIYAPSTGTVSKVYVQGQTVVEAGAPLFEIQLDHTLGTNRALSTQLLAALEKEQRSLLGQLALQREQLQLLQHTFIDQRELLRFELTQLELLESQSIAMLALRQKSVTRASTLFAEKLLSNTDYEAVELLQLQQQQTVAQTRLQQYQASGDLAQLQQQHESAVLRTNQEVQKLQFALAELEQQKLQLESGQTTTVTAPVAGVVSNKQIQQGMGVSVQSPALSLIPKDSIFLAEMKVPASAIGFIQKNQFVSIRYTAFPHQKFGVQSGNISSISSSLDQPSFNDRQPVYSARATLAKQSITTYGKEQPLLAGMEFTADVILDKRSLLEWLLEPLYSIKGEL